MLYEYLPILIFLALASLFATVMLSAGFVFGGSNPDDEKNSPYECGFEPFFDSRMKFDVRFYLVAILFIIFDLEIVGFWGLSLGLGGLFLPAFLAGLTLFLPSGEGLFLVGLVTGF